MFQCAWRMHLHTNGRDSQEELRASACFKAAHSGRAQDTEFRHFSAMSAISERAEGSGGLEGATFPRLPAGRKPTGGSGIGTHSDPTQRAHTQCWAWARAGLGAVSTKQKDGTPEREKTHAADGSPPLPIPLMTLCSARRSASPCFAYAARAPRPLGRRTTGRGREEKEEREGE